MSISSSNNHRNTKRDYAILIVIAILIGANVICVFIGQRFFEKPSQDQRRGGEDLGTEYYEYKLVEFGEWYSESWDQRLIRSNRQTGEEVVIVESTEGIVPELKRDVGLCLENFAMPENSNLIYFQSIYSETSDTDSIYSFDIYRNEFKKMKINEVCNESVGLIVLSPDQTKLVCIPESEDETGRAQMMYLASLADDNYQEVIKLPESQTFNGGGWGLSGFFDVEWLGNDRIMYSIYDQSKKEGYDYFYDSSQEMADKFFIKRGEYAIPKSEI